MTVQLAPPIVFQSILSNGSPNAFGTVATYIAGTTTPQATWTDSTQTTQNQNPTPLNALGQASIWLATNLFYKIIVFDALGNQINFQDQVPGGIPAGQIAGSLIPSPTNTYTLGNVTNSWAQLYLGPNSAPAFDTLNGNIAYYKQTAAELAASITPTNFSFASHLACGFVLPERYGAVGNGNAADTVNGALDTTAIGRAVTIATATGTPILLSRQYIAVPVTASTQEGPVAITVAWLMQSNLHVIGNRGASITLANGQSTDSVPLRLALFHTNSVLSNVSFERIIFDLNGANNTISPGRLNNIVTTAASGTGATATISFAAQTFAAPVGSNITVSGVTPTGYNGSYVITASTTTSVSYANATSGPQTIAGQISGGYNESYNQAAISVSGTPAGIAARIDDVLIDGCTFKNCAGVSQVVCAQSNTANVTIGKRWIIKKNLFLNNGTDTDDHTCVYAWVTTASFEDNIVWNDSPIGTIGNTGTVTGYEIHGSRHRVRGNVFYNCYRGMWVSANLTETTMQDTVIEGNIFDSKFFGIDFFRTASTQGQASGVTILGNVFRFDNYNTQLPFPQKKVAIQIASAYAQGQVLIEGNVATGTDNVVGAVFCAITAQSVASQTDGHIYVRGNYCEGFLAFFDAIATATNGFNQLSIENNDFINPTVTPTYTVTHGIYVNPVSTVKNLSIKGNNILDEIGGLGLTNGVYLDAGTITNYHYTPGLIVGATTAFYFENGTTVTNRMGVQVAGAATITYSAGMTPNAALGNLQTITANNGTAFTINNPTLGTPGQELTITLRNTSGGALGAATWGGGYKMSAWTNPANGNSRSITFKFDGTNWIQITQTGVDVPN